MTVRSPAPGRCRELHLALMLHHHAAVQARLLVILGLLTTWNAACGDTKDGTAATGSGGSGAGSAGASAGNAGTAAVLGGAGAGGEGGESPFPSDDSVDHAALTIADASCAHLFTCCPVYGMGFYADEQECFSQEYGSLKGAMFNNRQEVLAGRLAIHPEVAENCDSEPLACDESPWSCTKGLFEPLVALGGSCRFTMQCIEGYCSYETDLCEPIKPPGSECLYDDECTSGHCDYFGVGCTEPVPPAPDGCVEEAAQ